MSHSRILSFEMSQKVNEDEINQVAAAAKHQPKVETSLCEKQGFRDISVDF